MTTAPRILLLSLLLLVVPSVAAASDPAADGEALDRAAIQIYGDLMSPYCPGRTIASCPSPAAGDLRDEIRDSLATGQTREQIVADMERRFGAEVLGRPKDAWGFVVPLAVPVVAALGLVLWLRRGARARTPTDASDAPGSTEDAGSLERRLDRELDALT